MAFATHVCRFPKENCARFLRKNWPPSEPGSLHAASKQEREREQEREKERKKSRNNERKNKKRKKDKTGQMVPKKGTDGTKWLYGKHRAPVYEIQAPIWKIKAPISKIQAPIF